MNKIQLLKSFKEAFNKVSERITSNGCAKNCYSVFENYLKRLGFPESIIKDIYTGSGFSSWEEIHIARNANEHSIPVNKAIGKIKGISSAVNNMLNQHISTLEKEEGKTSEPVD